MKHSSIFSRLFLISVFLVIHCTPAVAAGGNGKPVEKSYPVFKYSETAAEPVIEYNLVHDMLAEQDPEPLLRIYGNGRVHVHYPAYMKKAGDYELQLSQPELRALLRTLATDGIIDFDPANTRLQRQQLEALQRKETGTLIYISDSSNTVIDIRLDEYQKGPGTTRVINLHKRFVWPDLKQDARRFPQFREITNANNGAQRLEALLLHDGLTKVR